MTERLVGSQLQALDIACDESGFTGPDLLQPSQRIFAYASVNIGDLEAFELIREARSRYPVQMPELKASQLLKSPNGRKIVRHLAQACHGRFAVNVYNKLLALCGWVFEYIYEPIYQQDMRLLYEKNFHLFVAMFIYIWVTADDETAKNAITQFQKYMRSKDPTDAPLFFAREWPLLDRGGAEDPFELVLRFAYGYRARITADNARLRTELSDGGKWTLDLSASALWSHLNHWGKTGRPLKVRCDSSKPLMAFVGNMTGGPDDPGIARARDLHRVEQQLGWHFAEPVSFVDSRGAPAIQLADIMAGAGLALANGNFGANEERIGEIFREHLLRDSIIPDEEVIDLKTRAAAVNWVILYDLAKRAEANADPHFRLAEIYRVAEVSWARGDFPPFGSKH